MGHKSSKTQSRTSSRDQRKVISIPETRKIESKPEQPRRSSEVKEKRRSKPVPASSSDTDYHQNKDTQKSLGNTFIKNTLAQMRRTMSTEEAPDPDDKFCLARRSISYEPRSIKKAEKQRPVKKSNKIETKKKDEEIFAEKLKARMKAS